MLPATFATLLGDRWMTDLQDSILDRFVGARIGLNWPDGPLAISAEVVGGTRPIQFGQTDNDRAAKGEIARRLGYPVILCEAIQGATRGLTAEDDRRALAMTLFRTLPLGGPIPKQSSQEQNRIAARIALRVHAYGCGRADCPVPKALAGLVASPTVPSEMAAAAARQVCTTVRASGQKKPIFGLTRLVDGVWRLNHTAEMAVRGFQLGKSVYGWCSVRESARLAASVRGVEEAVACCLAIGRWCGMPLSEPA
jgi:hypothetical protein